MEPKNEQRRVSPRLIVTSVLHLTVAVCYSYGSVAWFCAYITPCFGSSPHSVYNETRVYNDTSINNETSVYNETSVNKDTSVDYQTSVPIVVCSNETSHSEESILVREMPLVLKAISFMLNVTAIVLLTISLMCQDVVAEFRVSFNMFFIVGVLHWLQGLVGWTCGQQQWTYPSSDQVVLWTTSLSSTLFVLLRLEQCYHDCLSPPSPSSSSSCCCCFCFSPSHSRSSSSVPPSLLSPLSSSPSCFSAEDEEMSAKNERCGLLDREQLSAYSGRYPGGGGAKLCNSISESSDEENDRSDLQMEDLVQTCDHQK